MPNKCAQLLGVVSAVLAVLGNPYFTSPKEGFSTG